MPTTTRDKTARRAIGLLLPAQPPRKPDALVKIVHLLLACGTGRERAVVALHLFHGLTLPAVAARLSLPLARVKELFDSASNRLRDAIVTAKAENALAKWDQLDRKRGVKRYRCAVCGTSSTLGADDPLVCQECTHPLEK